MGHSFIHRKEQHVRLHDSEIEVGLYILEDLAARLGHVNKDLHDILHAWAIHGRDSAPGCKLLSLDSLTEQQREILLTILDRIIPLVPIAYSSGIPKGFLNGKHEGPGPDVFLEDYPTEKVVNFLSSLKQVLSDQT